MHERNAVSRAVRQGMTNHGTKVIRFVVKNTIEHERYLTNQKLKNNKNQSTNINQVGMNY